MKPLVAEWNMLTQSILLIVCESELKSSITQKRIECDILLIFLIFILKWIQEMQKQKQKN